MKKILFAASECVPFMKTGGLADVVGALPKEFDKNEWDVRVIMPNYRAIPDKFRNSFQYITHFYMGTGPYVQNAHVGIMKYEYEGKELTNTMTFGISSSLEADSLEQLVKLADERLYLGKQKGKNQVV